MEGLVLHSFTSEHQHKTRTLVLNIKREIQSSTNYISKGKKGAIADQSPSHSQLHEDDTPKGSLAIASSYSSASCEGKFELTEIKTSSTSHEEKSCLSPEEEGPPVEATTMSSHEINTEKFEEFQIDKFPYKVVVKGKTTDTLAKLADLAHQTGFLLSLDEDRVEHVLQYEIAVLGVACPGVLELATHDHRVTSKGTSQSVFIIDGRINVLEFARQVPIEVKREEVEFRDPFFLPNSEQPLAKAIVEKTKKHHQQNMAAKVIETLFSSASVDYVLSNLKTEDGKLNTLRIASFPKVADALEMEISVKMWDPGIPTSLVPSIQLSEQRGSQTLLGKTDNAGKVFLTNQYLEMEKEVYLKIIEELDMGPVLKMMENNEKSLEKIKVLLTNNPEVYGVFFHVLKITIWGPGTKLISISYLQNQGDGLPNMGSRPFKFPNTATDMGIYEKLRYILPGNQSHIHLPQGTRIWESSKEKVWDPGITFVHALTLGQGQIEGGGIDMNLKVPHYTLAPVSVAIWVQVQSSHHSAECIRELKSSQHKLPTCLSSQRTVRAQSAY